MLLFTRFKRRLEELSRKETELQAREEQVIRRQAELESREAGEKKRREAEETRVRKEEEIRKRREEERLKEEARLKTKEEEERNKRESEIRAREEEIIRRQAELSVREEQVIRRQAELRVQEEDGKRQQEIVEIKEEFNKLRLSNNRRGKYDIHIFGDSEELHDRASRRNGDFQHSIGKVRTSANGKMQIKIGVSRFNFFRLNKIIQFCSLLLGHRLDMRTVSLDLLPLEGISKRFIDHVRELNARIGRNKITLFLEDQDLPGLLETVASQANRYREKELLRLMGLICEHPFIGPQTIVLDTYHRCNTNCMHCWIHTPRRKTSPRLINLKMDPLLYRKIIDDAADLLCDEIIIQGDGEPLLDPRFFEMVRYAKNKGLRVIFFTNAILLDKNKARQILDLEIDEVLCSLPAGVAQTYAAINSMQSEKTFSKIVANLRNLIALRRESGRDTPTLQVSHVIHKMNCHELEAMAKVDAYIGADKARFYLARLDENIRFLKLESSHLQKVKDSLKNAESLLAKHKVALQDNIYFQLEHYDCASGDWSGEEFLKSGCPVGWFFCLILARGELSMCCHLRVIDYLRDKSFSEAWNSEGYNRFRIQAKYLKQNKNTVFLNGVRLYDAFCRHCDTHQVALRIHGLIRQYNLERFL